MDMRALVDYLNETAYQYYTLGEPTISDAEWDKKYDELRRMEEETGERLPDSPTRRVGAQPLANFEQHTHLARLWSLDKAQSEGALREWAARADKLAGEQVEYVVEHKFDGLTINLTYENGQLVEIIEYQHHRKSQARAVVRVKLRNIHTGGLIETAYRPEDKFKEVEVEKRPFTYLYTSGDMATFMNT